MSGPLDALSLSNISVFRNLTPAELGKLSSLMRCMVFPADANIMTPANLTTLRMLPPVRSAHASSASAQGNAAMSGGTNARRASTEKSRAGV